jgi:fibronectin-binding autotransporter adhesin
MKASRSLDGASVMRGATALSIALAVLLLAAATALALTGQITQLPGTAGCISNNGTGGACADGKALYLTRAVTVSPDGKNVYSITREAVAAFSRSSTTGGLTQLPGTAGCVSETGTNGQCVDGKALDGTTSLAVSPDGKNVYVASVRGDSVAVFNRNATTGQLTQLSGTAGCVSRTGTGGECAVGRALDDGISVRVSPDGKNVYVSSRVYVSSTVPPRGLIAVFQRDETTGRLSQLPGPAACVSETRPGCRPGRALYGFLQLAISPDGKNVYVASGDSDAIAVFKRNPTSGALLQPQDPSGCVSETGTGGTCTDGKALRYPVAVALSADGKSVYVVSGGSSAVAAFRRNSTTGALTQLVGPAGKAGCVSQTGTGGACARGKLLDAPSQLAVSADGQSVYVVSTDSDDAVAALSRDTTSGALAQLPGTAGCVSETGTGGACADGRALNTPVSVAVSPDGKNVYVGTVDSNAIAIFAREPPS